LTRQAGWQAGRPAGRQAGIRADRTPSQPKHQILDKKQIGQTTKPTELTKERGEAELEGHRPSGGRGRHALEANQVVHVVQVAGGEEQRGEPDAKGGRGAGGEQV